MSEERAYELGRQDAAKNRYPLYSTLLAAEKPELADKYSAGWSSVKGRGLSTFRDGRSR